MAEGRSETIAIGITIILTRTPGDPHKTEPPIGTEQNAD
ncbi:hypothetical protein AM1_5832 [Acaryochloris marina MBIC11017]|uniref:Uncharacterized protein n=1 Tax=Acaryochloris marina (strain MBIC 11017) TaxID=329726 RepID=B0C0I0_ACAM1|nr:hypothetical protein AM1_5832 [Acaryochloris marina MBIC11017]